MKKIKGLFLIALSFSFILTGCNTKKSDELDADNPVSISIWHYYNGAQLESFNRLVENFNDTVGKEKGIIVSSSSQGSVNDLENNVLDAINGKAGAAKVPNIFAAYADTAYTVDQLGYLAELNEYFSKEELNEYIDNYIEEGYFGKSLKIFPIAKSTEVLMINQTDWDKFASATGSNIDALNTFEGISETAKKYYEWSDSLTVEANDGKAFFGRDALANFFIIGFKQHGKNIFSVTDDGSVSLDFDKEIVRKIWDNYYVPYVKGYFASSGRFRSDDIKIGNIISFIGSSSGASFFPNEVILNDEESYPIESNVIASPIFEGQNKVAVQQGAGMVVTKATKKEEQACVAFLKWFTQKEQNIDFSISSGYLPVKKEANNMDQINSHILSKETKIEDVVQVAIGTVNSSEMYTTKAFANGTKARTILEYSLKDKADADRKTFVSELANGISFETLVSRYDNEANYEEWYEATKADLEALIK